MVQSVDPFVDIMVSPSYGANKAIVRWKLHAGFENSDCFVYKSASGVRPWILLNPNDPVRNHTAYEDDGFSEQSVLVNTYYRLALRVGDVIYDSPIISTFDKLSRLQYQYVRKSMIAELRTMMGGLKPNKGRAPNALRMWHFIPLEFGVQSKEIDAQSSQRTAVIHGGEGGYGQLFKGGYSKPSWTYVRMKKITQKRTDRADGLGVDEDSKASARMLGFPVPQRGHVLVHPATDNRWAVEEDVTPYLMFGVAPVAFDVSLSLISRGDERYDIPVPGIPS